MSKKKPDALAALYVEGLTNADVDAFNAAGFLPIIRWVSKNGMWSAKPRLLYTHYVRGQVKKRAAKKPKKGKN